MNKIAVILPAYNEEVALGSLILRAKRHAQQIIVVDDGSTDKTSEVAELAGAEVIKHSKNLGKGAAIRSGFAAVKDAEVIVTIDADAQHNPDEIPLLAAPIIEGKADVVNGSRYIKGNDENTPAYRRVGQKVLDTATSISSGSKISDSQSGFRAFSAKAIPYFRFKDKGFGVESEMLVDASQAGLKIEEVEIGVRYDVESSTQHPLKHGVKVLFNILQDMELKRPLYYFTLPGLIVVIIGAILSLFFFRDYVTGVSINIGPTLVSVMFTLFGTFLMFTGIILDSMSRMILQSRNRI